MAKPCILRAKRDNIMGKIIAIDFDDTIHDPSQKPTGGRMGKPFEGCAEVFQEFLDKGFEIVIFCVWADDEKNIATIGKWLDYFKLPYHKITNIKPAADYFIDDRAVHFKSWPQVRLEILAREATSREDI